MIKSLRIVTEGVRFLRNLKWSLASDRNYISKHLFYLWWKVGDYLRFKSESYVDKVIRLNKIKQTIRGNDDTHTANSN
jgi:hypothetical protein